VWLRAAGCISEFGISEPTSSRADDVREPFHSRRQGTMGELECAFADICVFSSFLPPAKSHQHFLRMLNHPMLANARMRAGSIDQMWAFFGVLGRPHF
jgi:hypothetical protein